jgi:hypothetical protein
VVPDDLVPLEEPSRAVLGPAAPDQAAPDQAAPGQASRAGAGVD